ncbi:MAG: hypothetical protein ACTS5G_02910, partial [Burkholderiales bacterium]
MVFFWRKKTGKSQPVTEPPSSQIRKGFLSTHIQPEGHLSLKHRLTKALAQTFQVDPTPKLHAIDANGTAMDGCDTTGPRLVGSRLGPIPLTQLEWYSGQGFIGWQMCALLSQNWLIDKACSMPGKDAVRNGWEITVNDGSTLT